MTAYAFIGLGNMGGPMAVNFKKHGDVAVYDPTPEAQARAKAGGLIVCANVAEAVKGATTVVTMLPAGPHVRSVYMGDDGILAHAPKGALLIDSSTIDVESARTVAKAASDAGFRFADAPVSGGVAAATGGTLTFMVGSADADFEAVKAALTPMAKAVIHAGGYGAGQAAKICNNMLLAITMVGTAEAFGLAQKLGLDAQKFFDIASVSSGQNWSMTSYCPVAGPVPTSPANKGYAPGFAANIMLKDLKLAQAAASSVGATIPMGSEATALYTLFDGLGYGPKDFSGVMALLSGQLQQLS